MILETAQLLCSVHWLNDSEAPYRLTHKNHPCSIWARECLENYQWLCRLGLALCDEYTSRYHKTHKTEDVIEWCRVNVPSIKKLGHMTDFALAMPDEYKCEDAVFSYRTYYVAEKLFYKKRNRVTRQTEKVLNSWKNGVPDWF